MPQSKQVQVSSALNPSMEESSYHHPPVKTAMKQSIEKMRRDEWSETGVMSLLEAYESKWSLRNRAKLKGTDWYEIASQVSSRCSGGKTSKTPNQCKNKIESMKKRYRAETANAAGQNHSGSSWQFYDLMNGLLNSSPFQPNPTPKVELKKETNNVHDDDDDDDGSNTLPNSKLGKRKKRSKVVECVVLLGQSMLKIEEMRMEVWKETERLRAEAEIKRGEMELKRTEIIADTLLQIAGIFARRRSGGDDKNQTSSFSVRSEADY